MGSSTVALPADAVDVQAASGLPPDAIDIPKDQDHTTFGGALKEYWNKINPLAAGNAMVDAATHPVEATKGYGEQTGKMLDAAQESFKKGNYAEGVRHGLSYLLNGIPGIGSALDEAGNKAQKGDYAGAAADTAALATNIYVGTKLPKIANAAAEGIDSAIENVPKATRAVGRVLASPETLPTAPEMGTAIVSPKGAGLHYAARQLTRIMEAIKAKPMAAPAPEAAPAVAPEPVSTIVPGEAPPAARPQFRQDIVSELNVKPNPVPGASNTLTSPETAPEVDIHPKHAASRTALAADMADFLHSNGRGIDYETALRMGPDQWKMARGAVREGEKVAAPSPATIQLTLEKLQKIQEAQPKPMLVAKPAAIGAHLNPRARAIAEKMAAAMEAGNE